MARDSSRLESDDVPAERLRHQLERVLGSQVFAQAPTLSRLLRYLVERTLAGDDDQLKEYALGVEVFGRGTSFDPRTDTIVRVQARRLRSRLQDYYRAEGVSDPLVLDLPKGRYRLEWRRAGTGDASGDAAVAAVSAPSIVVLPFTNLSGDPANEYFSDGLSEEIISGLAAVSDLRVVARTSAFQFKGRAEDIRKIGRELGVTAALEGSVRKEGRRIRATAQLIDVADGFHLWSETFDRELTDVFTIQEDITRAIVAALQVRLAPASGAATSRPPVTPTPEAYEWYLRGRFFYHKVTPPAAVKSVECMERATTCDGSYAAAHAGLADACLLLTSLAVDRPLPELLDKARRAAAAALHVDPASAEAHCAVAAVAAVADWEFAAAAQHFERALALKPSFVHARMSYSVTCLSPLRRHAEAIAQLRLALDSDPMSILLRTMLGQALILAGDTEAATDHLRQTVELEPGFVFARYTLGLALIAGQQYAAARDVLEQGESLGASNCIGHLGYAYARLGKRAKAQRLLQELLERPWVPAVDVAAIYTALDDRHHALAWLGRARERREFDALFLADDPRFQDLRSEGAL